MTVGDLREALAHLSEDMQVILVHADGKAAPLLETDAECMYLPEDDRVGVVWSKRWTADRVPSERVATKDEWVQFKREHDTVIILTSWEG